MSIKYYFVRLVLFSLVVLAQIIFCFHLMIAICAHLVTVCSVHCRLIYLSMPVGPVTRRILMPYHMFTYLVPIPFKFMDIEFFREGQ